MNVNHLCNKIDSVDLSGRKWAIDLLAIVSLSDVV